MGMGRGNVSVHGTEALESSLGRRVALTEVDGLVSVMGTWLLHTSSGSSIRALVNGRLHLLQELIDVHQIILRSQVGHWRKSILVLWHWASVAAMAFNRNHCRTSRNVVGQTTSLDGDALKLHQALANLSVGAWIDLTTLSVTEEVIQHVETTPSVVISGVVAQVASVADGIVDRTVGLGLLRGIVAVVCVVGRVGAILGGRAGVHLRGMVIVTAGGSCKILQVSNHCKLPVKYGYV